MMNGRDPDSAARLANDFLASQLAAGREPSPAAAAGCDFCVQSSASAPCGLAGITDLSDGETATLKYTGLDLRSMLAHACGASKWAIEISTAVQERELDFIARVPLAARGLARPLLGLAVLAAHGASARRARKEAPVLALRSSGESPHAGLAAVPAAGSCSWGRGQAFSSGMTMRDLASSLEDEFGLPVLDETALGGTYRMELKWTDRDSGSLKAALEAGLGILAVRELRPMDVLLVFPADEAPEWDVPRDNGIFGIFKEVNI